MIKYPQLYQDTCGPATPPEPNRSDIQRDICISRTIAQIGDSLAAMDTTLAIRTEQLNDQRQQHQETRAKLDYAEKQEEICGLIAKGEFKKTERIENGPLRSRWNEESYHDYTDSQKAVKELLASRTLLIAKESLNQKAIESAKTECKIYFDQNTNLLKKLKDKQDENDRLYAEIR